jgi:hypothetical protein
MERVDKLVLTRNAFGKTQEKVGTVVSIYFSTENEGVY